MRQVKRKDILPYNNKIFSTLILLAVIFMGVGYASINSISLDVAGDIVAKAQDGIFITEVNYVERSDSLPNEDSLVLFADNTILKSSVNLEPNDSSSEVSLKISFYNSTEYDYVFRDVVYAEELTDEMDEIYSNLDIVYTFNNQDKTINKNGGILDVIVTFKYDKINDSTSNVLNSILNFKFSIQPYVVAEYGYTGNYETFVVPRDGIYQVELWGASGGDDSTHKIVAEAGDGTYTERTVTFTGGYGGYTSGEIQLTENDQLYVYIGEMGQRDLQPIFNGGGSGAIGGAGYNGTNPTGDSNLSGYSGGGATDIRLVNGEWDEFESLKSRIMVAAGGGGSTVETYSGAGAYSQAGGLIGFNGGYYPEHPFVETGQNGKGGTQTSGGIAATIHFNATGVITDGSFGIGGSTTSISSQTGAGGGGGGYYGGSGASGTLAGGSGQGGGGGSSFISGHEGCDAITQTSTLGNIIHIGSSEHYSGYIFTNTTMIDGFGYAARFNLYNAFIWRNINNNW